MIKQKTALGVFIELIEQFGRLPDKNEFMNCGFSKTTYYRTRNNYYDYLKSRVEEVEEGGNPTATYEDDIAEGFIVVKEDNMEGC